MWPFKKKIKEEPKARLYGNRYNSGKSDFSAWESLSIIEKFCLVFLPIILCYIFYIMLEMTGLIWWIRLLISIGIVTGCIGLITLLVTWFTGGDW